MSAPIQSPALLPTPIQIQISTFLFSDSAANETSPIKVELELEKKLVGAYVKIPCIDNSTYLLQLGPSAASSSTSSALLCTVGSCTYDDACALLSKLVPLGPDGKCPAPLPSVCLFIPASLALFEFSHLPSSPHPPPSSVSRAAAR